MWVCIWHWWNDTDRGNRSSRRNVWPSAPLSTKKSNLHWPSIEPVPHGLRYVMLVSNDFTYIMYYVIHTYIKITYLFVRVYIYIYIYLFIYLYNVRIHFKFNVIHFREEYSIRRGSNPPHMQFSSHFRFYHVFQDIKIRHTLLVWLYLNSYFTHN